MKKYIKIILTTTILFSLSVTTFAHEYATSFLFGGTTVQYNNYVENTDNTLNSVSPDYFEISADGNLIYTKIDVEFISNMKEKGIKVMPFISNHWDKNLGLAALKNTEILTSQIANQIYINDLDGINIDIENVSHLQKEDYTNFVKVLRGKIPDKIISVSVAANPNSWKTGWHGSYDYKNLAETSDYLLIMGYDESYFGSEAGPVASSNFVEKSILYALNETTADKIVLGIPFFGRYWKNGEKVGGHGITSMDIENLLANYKSSKDYDINSQSAQVFLEIKEDDVMPKLWGGTVLTSGKYEIWYDDLNSTKYKLALVDKYNLKGSASWALGQDDIKIWKEYSNYKKVESDNTSLITVLNRGTAPVNTNPTETSKPTNTQLPTETSKPTNISKITNTLVPYLVDDSNFDPVQNTTDNFTNSLPISAINSDMITSTPEIQNNINVPSSTAIPSPIIYNDEPNITNNTNSNNINSNKVSGDKTIRSWTSEESYDENNSLIRIETIKIQIKQAKDTSDNSNEENNINYNLNEKSNINDILNEESTINIGNDMYNQRYLRKPDENVSKYYNSLPILSENKSKKTENEVVEAEVISKGWIALDEYKRNKYLTRSEAIKILMRMGSVLEEPKSYINSFDDINNHPDKDFILKAEYYGIIKDDGINKFYPDKEISKEDLVIYMERLFNLPDTVNFESEKINDIFKNENSETYYAINKFYEHEIIDVDSKGNFYPDFFITMGEMAKIAHRLDGCGIRELQASGDNKNKILEPR